MNILYNYFPNALITNGSYNYTLLNAVRSLIIFWKRFIFGLNNKRENLRPVHLKVFLNTATEYIHKNYSSTFPKSMKCYSLTDIRLSQFYCKKNIIINMLIYVKKKKNLSTKKIYIYIFDIYIFGTI